MTTAGNSRYDFITVCLHWITALLVIVLFATAIIWGYLPRESGGKQFLEPLHVSLGIGLAAVLFARIVWRLTKGRKLPKAGYGVPAVLASLVHWALYGLLTGQVVLGFVLRWLQGDSLDFFGLFAIPALLASDRALSRSVQEMHEYVAWALIIVAGGHAIAALVHHYALKDDVLARMMPAVRKSAPTDA